MTLLPQVEPVARSAAERDAEAARRRAILRVATLPERVADWPEDARDRWEERASIMEFGGCMPREMAARRAEVSVREAVAREALGTGEAPR